MTFKFGSSSSTKTIKMKVSTKRMLKTSNRRVLRETFRYIINLKSINLNGLLIKIQYSLEVLGWRGLRPMLWRI